MNVSLLCFLIASWVWGFKDELLGAWSIFAHSSRTVLELFGMSPEIARIRIRKIIPTTPEENRLTARNRSSFYSACQDRPLLRVWNIRMVAKLFRGLPLYSLKYTPISDHQRMHNFATVCNYTANTRAIKNREIFCSGGWKWASDQRLVGVER